MKLGAYYKQPQHAQADAAAYRTALEDWTQRGRPIGDCVRELRQAYRRNLQAYDLVTWRQIERIRAKGA